MPEDRIRRRTALLAAVLLLVAAVVALSCRSTGAGTEGASSAPLILEAVPEDWTAYAGRTVTIAAPLTIDGTYAVDRFGEILASFGDRPWVPTEVARPGEPAAAVARENARRRIVLDDGLSGEIRGLPAYLPDSVDARRPLRAGSIVRGVTGIVEIVRGAPRVQLTRPLSGLVEQSARPPAPDVSGAVRIAGLNVLNLFNGDGLGSGFPTGRGAATSADYLRQRAKIVEAIQALRPDIAALQEIENDGYGPESSLAQLVEALNAAGPTQDWRFVATAERPGSDDIRVALVYRASRVEPVGAAAVLLEGPFLTHSRPPLAQAFRRGAGQPFTVVANHFKSKSCGRDDQAATGVDADLRDGQGCWNAKRSESARLLVEWLETEPTGTQADRSVLLGDFNSYAMEDPIRLLAEAGWTDAFAAAPGREQPYSYVYGGERGRLDHALVGRGLADRVRQAAVWNSNSDELLLFGYERGIDRSPYRASDHDPLLIGIDP